VVVLQGFSDSLGILEMEFKLLVIVTSIKMYEIKHKIKVKKLPLPYKNPMLSLHHSHPRHRSYPSVKFGSRDGFSMLWEGGIST